MRSQRIYEGRMFQLDRSSYTTTDTHLLLIRCMCLSILCFICFRVLGGVKFLCWEWFYMSSRLVVSRSWSMGGISRGYDYKLHHTLGTMYPKCGDAVT
ncbi:hypothetical protein HanIR_Chr07g0321861 [Helianthus annuus]|nr:hypothetical protein HanIR_Chr07g0321861 [Helianthus annuus]